MYPIQLPRLRSKDHYYRIALLAGFVLILIFGLTGGLWSMPLQDANKPTSATSQGGAGNFGPAEKCRSDESVQRCGNSYCRTR